MAQNFIDVYNSYKDAKEVTKRRIYLETLREVLEGKNKIILDDTGNGQGVVPYLPLNELKKKVQIKMRFSLRNLIVVLLLFIAFLTFTGAFLL